MAFIKISNREDTGTRIRELFKNLQELERYNNNIIDLRDVQWVTPLSLLPLAAKITEKFHKSKFSISEKFEHYFNAIFFPGGISAYQVNPYASYIPILHLNIKEDCSKALIKYDSLLWNVVKDEEYKENIINAIRYLVGEIIANIEDHSKSRDFWMFAQYWRTKEEIEICILDNGIGFKERYKEVNIECKNDTEAIQKAIDGWSSKYVEGYTKRGWGIRTSIKLVTESDLRGEIVIITGSAAWWNNKGSALFFIAPENTQFWRGSIVMIRVKKPQRKINIYDYVE